MAIVGANRGRSALLKAVRFQLQARLDLNDDSCEIGLDGQPKPMSGELYIAIHPGPWREILKGDIGKGYSYGCKVTITRRMGVFPKDRWHKAWLEFLEGIEDIADLVMGELAGDNTGSLDTQSRYALIRKANEYIGIPVTDPPTWEGGFQVPLNLVDGGMPEPKGQEWFTSPSGAGEDGEELMAGVAQTLTFDGAERYHVLSIPIIQE